VRRGLRHRLVLALVAAAVLAPAAHGANYLRLGFDDDTLKWMVRPDGYVGVQRELGAPFTRIKIPWSRGAVRPGRLVTTYLDRAARAGRLHQKVVLAVYGDASQAPVDARSRDRYCRFVRSLFKAAPDTAAVVIWNEANSPRYWPPAAGAPAYETLLARCYDVLHAFRANVNVVDSTASHYDPAGFITALGEAYRASGRDRPIIDTFGHNPYPEYAAEDPWATHTGTIGEGDYATLMAAITDAFRSTAQRVPSATWARLWYLEDGFQTEVPWPFGPFYAGRENDRTALPAVALRGKSQASQLTAAIELAFCQPAVSAFFNFTLIDERRLAGWQSGLMYTNGARKPSFDAYQEVAAAVANRTVDCSHVVGAPSPAAAPRPH
jgi:hypothetical protein